MMKIITSLLLIVFLFLVTFLVPRMIVVEEIECANQYGVCRPDLLNRISPVKNKRLRTSRIYLEEVLENDLLVKRYSIHYRLPNRLEIDVIDRKPRYALASELETGYRLVDEAGYVISKSTASSLPVVFIKSKLPEPGDKLDEELKFALELTKDTSTLFHVNNSAYDEDKLVINLDDLEVVFPLDGDKKLLVGSLNMILLRLNSNNEDTKIEQITTIDLRYKNPVLKM